MNVLLTGGAGYIGSIAADILLEAGHHVTVYDSLVTGYRAAIPDQADFVHADLADKDMLERTLQEGSFEAVLHFAAFIEAGESMRDPGKYLYNNVALSLGLIEACVHAGVPRFVLSSSAGVYASSQQMISEEARLEPSNVYGQTKLMVEQSLEWYRRIHGLRYAALRYFNAAGAWAGRGEAHSPETHLIPIVLQVALGQRPHVEVFGTDYPTPDGTCIRDYIHVADLVEAHLLALEALGENDWLVYNLGNGTGYSVREVIESGRQVTGHAIPAKEAPRRPGDAPWLVASAEKIGRELGWEPKRPALGDIIASAWDWHKAHPQGYD
ncbi:MAG: UDP-glucose 4-epimerase GalE [Anaerolineales bacterium]|jgi:UDP-glucose 4-epimerase